MMFDYRSSCASLLLSLEMAVNLINCLLQDLLYNFYGIFRTKLSIFRRKTRRVRTDCLASAFCVTHICLVDASISNFRGVWCTFSIFILYFEYIFLLANSEDLDQTPRSVASDLGLHCLPVSQKWDAMLIWVK